MTRSAYFYPTYFAADDNNSTAWAKAILGAGRALLNIYSGAFINYSINKLYYVNIWPEVQFIWKGSESYLLIFLFLGSPFMYETYFIQQRFT